ncbi:MAG: pyruvate:ferredoxin (flavodoxin) oxidoreductase [Planctomycetes bacterium]|nr:pyruvate:ferredoxin (flavodoxin) oxidoreductase [Planctomycetota bacterium]
MSNIKTVDGNTAAAHVAYAFSDVAAIYPITPSSGMGELADEWAAGGMLNMFGQPVDVIEMQSEAGAAGAVHGALTAGAFTTTFTASQGLLLMIPNMYKIAGEMLPTVFHVSARSLACQSLSIFGDHSDVMAVRNTGFAMTAAGSIQETADLALVAHLATLESKIPFLSFFDGFRTSHEVQKVELPAFKDMASLLDTKYVEDFRSRALSPENPVAKVGAQNPDVYFQGRETVNTYYDAIPGIVKKYMKKVEEKFGRAYKLFDYVGHPDAETVVIAMGSATETIHETVEWLVAKGEKVGLIKVRLYRPFSIPDFLEVLPSSVKAVVVLDRTKEPGAIGEPLYLDIVAATRGKNFHLIGGRYGLSSKEFTPPMVKTVFDHASAGGRHGFTVGINDDVSKLSLTVKEEINTEAKNVVRCKFWGLGSDGTVGANKNSIKIIGDNTNMEVQAYFVYDSKKSGGITISHLRFGKEKIRSQYLLTTSDFIALHNPSYIGRYDILEGIKVGGTFLLNASYSPEEAFDNLTEDMQKTIIEKKVKFFCIDATKIANAVGLGNRISTVMQAAFFIASGVLDQEEAIGLIKKAIDKSFRKKSDAIVEMNWNAVDRTKDALIEIKIPAKAGHSAPQVTLIADNAGDFARNIIKPVMHLKGDDIPVSQMPLDGKVPTGTTRLEKRGVAVDVPKWIPENCIQCGQCSFVCPHAAIRIKQIDEGGIATAPASFRCAASKAKSGRDLKFTVQVYPEDCIGCGVCAEVCPTKVKSLEMIPLEESRAAGETVNAEYFDGLPDILDGVKENTLKWSQLKRPLFEFSGACSGCGETAYVKLVTQLFGERMIVANATGCSSIYGGTFPTIPYCKNADGKGPAWANSLFEDNAEYGFGMRLAVDSNRRLLRQNAEMYLSKDASSKLGLALQKSLECWNKVDDGAQQAATAVRTILPEALKGASGELKTLVAKMIELEDYFIDKSVWIFGGDGWAYDIGYGGLDHVLASNRNVNVLVLDTEVYSNTGGQASKSTPRGAVAKFAASGKKMGKKNLGLMMMSYGSVYVASVNMGANKSQVLKALIEAENYPGPSIVVAYCTCIAHGIDMRHSMAEQDLAAKAGHWPLYRFNPELEHESKNPFSWDSKVPDVEYNSYILNEIRYKVLEHQDPEEAKRLFKLAADDSKKRFAALQNQMDQVKAGE